MDRERASAVNTTPEGRRRCPKGHLMQKRKKTHCQTCWRLTTEKGRAASKQGTKRYRQTEKGKVVTQRISAKCYYKRRVEMGMTTDEAVYRIVLGNEVETQRRLAAYREKHRQDNLHYRQRWGYIYQNPLHRIRWENIRTGQWKEEEHPL